MDTIVTVLVHYNTDKETRACVDSLLAIQQGDVKHQIVVLDNASKKPLKLPQEMTQSNTVDLLRSEANLGFTGGNNLAIAHALEHYKPDFVILLNNDTLIDPAAVTHLYRFLKANPQVGLVSPKIYSAKGSEFHTSSYKPSHKGSVIWYGGGSIDWRNLYAFHRGVDEVDLGQVNTQTTSDFATGCCVLINRTVLETIGS